MTSAREGGGRQRVQGLQALLFQYLRQKRQCLRQYLHSEPKGLGQCPKQSTDPSASGTPKDPCPVPRCAQAAGHCIPASQERLCRALQLLNLPLRD